MQGLFSTETLPRSTAGRPSWCCPVHREPMDERDGVLACPRGDAYPIRGGIPRFVASEGYAALFGSQWARYPRTQLDSHTGTTITLDRARRCLGEALWGDLAGAQVLECGCGAGRFTEVLLDRGADVTSIDLSAAVEVNRDNFPPGDSHRIAQADILRLPFRPGGFDVVLCLGVVQHTPHPETTIAALYEMVRPGGWLVIDHYTYDRARFTNPKAVVRAVLKRLPRDRALLWTERLFGAFWPLHLRARRSRLARFLLGRITPLACYLDAYPELGDEQQREWSLLDTHDMLTDWFKHYRTRDQVERALVDLGLEAVWCREGGNGVEARGRRPSGG